MRTSYRRSAAATLLALLALSVCSTMSVEAQPGIATANPQADAEARRLLQYLYTLPLRPNHPIISGQLIGAVDGYVADSDTKMSVGFRRYVRDLQAETGKSVGMIGVNFARLSDCVTLRHERRQAPQPFMACDDESPDFSGAVALMTDYWRHGGLVTVMWHTPNPWTGNGAHDLTIKGDFSDLYKEGTTAHTTWRKMLDEVAVGLQQLQQQGVVVLFRPLHEQNGSWFWWGDHGGNKQPSSSEFKRLWCDMFQYFTKTKQLNNILWVFSPARDASAAKMLEFDPGENYYDILGIDYYEDVLDKPLACADLRAIHKPIALAEYGPIDRYARDPSTYRKFDYMRLFALLKRCPDFSYFMAWTGRPDTSQSLVDNRNANLLLNDPRVLDRGSIDWR